MLQIWLAIENWAENWAENWIEGCRHLNNEQRFYIWAGCVALLMVYLHIWALLPEKQPKNTKNTKK